MTDQAREGRLQERWRMPLRVAAVVIAYVIYRLPGDDRLMAGVALGAGFLLVSFVVVDHLTLGAASRSRAAVVVRVLLGIALIALGSVLAVR